MANANRAEHPGQGSVGASGDLAPLAHLASVLIGEGEARVNGKLVPGAAALAAAGLQPVELAPKEGLALLNGTQVSTALALAGLFAAERAMAAAFVAGALTSACPAAVRRSTPAFKRCAAVAARSMRRACIANCRGSAIRASHVIAAADPYGPLPAAGDGRVPRSEATWRVCCSPKPSGVDNPLCLPPTTRFCPAAKLHAEPVALPPTIWPLPLPRGALSERRPLPHGYEPFGAAALSRRGRRADPAS